MKKRLSFIVIMLISSSVYSHSVRSIEGQAVDGETTARFAETAFASGKMFAGSLDTNGSIFSLTRFRITPGANENNATASALAPDGMVSVNGAQAAHPLKDQQIEALSLMAGRSPIAAVKAAAAADGSKNSLVLVTDISSGKIVFTNEEHQIQDAEGNEVLDAGVAALAASKERIFIAVPPSGGTFGSENSGFAQFVFDGTQLSMIKFTGFVGQEAAYKLNLDAHKSGVMYPIAPLKTHQQVQCAFSPDPTNAANIASCVLGEDVAMWWDNKLQRLFVALSGASGATNKSGGVQALLVGRLTKQKQLILEPMIDLKIASSIFTVDKDHFIFGFQGKHAMNHTASLLNVRTMHTSTGRSYVVVVGGVEQSAFIDKVNSQVFALPLVPTKKSDGSAHKESDIGRIAQKVEAASGDDLIEPVLVTGDMTLATDRAAIVGADHHYLCHALDSKVAAENHPTLITDMEIVGDTVYVSAAGSRLIDGDSETEQKQEAGIFASTALFNQDGAIRAWTPWQRVMGKITPVFGFGFDEQTQNFFYLTGEDDASANVMAITQWNKGDDASTADGGLHDGKPLSSVLDGIVNNAVFGPVYGLFNFSDETPGFQVNDIKKSYPEFSMMVATGYQRVALIQTGQAIDGVFGQTVQFAPDESVFIFNDDALKKIGLLSCAEVSRIPVNTSSRSGDEFKGWLFVGGSGGVAVLRKADGSGWQTGARGGAVSGLNQLSGMDFPGKVTNDKPDWSFILLKDKADPVIPPNQKNPPVIKNIFENTRKLVSDGKYLYIVTRSKVFRLLIDKLDFTKGIISAARLKVIVDVDESKDFQDNFFLENEEIVDFMVIDRTSDGRRFLLATSVGLWESTETLLENGTVNGMSPLESLAWANTVNNNFDAPFPLGHVGWMEFIPAQRSGVFNGDKADGNLLVMATDAENKKFSMYRFNIQEATEGLVPVRAFTEPYFKGNAFDTVNKQFIEANRTPEFFTVGTLDAGFAPNLDELSLVPNHFDTQSVPMVPLSSYFEKAFEKDSAIILGKQLPINISRFQLVRDAASGAVYVPGTFGVRVNE